MNSASRLCHGLFLAMCTAMISGCQRAPATPRSGQTGAGTTRESEAMVRFQEAVRNELWPRTDELSTHEITSRLGQLAQKHLVFEKAALLENAAAAIERLPRAEPIDRADYVPSLREEHAEAVAAGWRLLPQQGVKTLMAADPVGLARNIRTSALARQLGQRLLSKRIMVEKYAPPVAMALSADRDAPVISLHMPGEVFVVHLRLVDSVYEPTKVEWLRKKPP